MPSGDNAETTPPEISVTTAGAMLPEIESNGSEVLNSTTAIVTWQPVAGANGYNIYLYREGEQVGDPTKVLKTPIFTTLAGIKICCLGYRE